MTGQSYQPPRCKTCRHTAGEHGHTRRSLFADPSDGGRCFAPGCECTRFAAEGVEPMSREEFERHLVEARRAA